MAGSATVKPSEIEAVLKGFMQDHIVLVENQAKADIELAAKETVDDLKKTSPYETHSKGARGRHYRTGWKFDIDMTLTGKTRATVYNSTKPGLTHLLEHGHGGKHPARAYPHIGPAFNRAKAKLEARMR